MSDKTKTIIKVILKAVSYVITLVLGALGADVVM